MIAASEPQEFVPFGRQKIKNHPGTIIVQPPSQALSEHLLVQRLSEVNIHNHTENEWWILRELVVGEGEGQIGAEEELYVKDKTAIWSKGTVGYSVANICGEQPAGRTLICSYTVESTITHALWVNFVRSSENSGETSMPSVCLLDDTKVNVYTREGEDFLSALQFKVSSAWSTKFGLLLERYTSPQTKPSENNLATLFSLLHPLDETAPLLIMKNGGSLQYMNDPNLKVVFTNEEPSLVVLFNLQTGLHSVWKLRKATQQESQVFCGGDLSTCTTFAQSSLHMSDVSQISSSSQRASIHNRSSFTPAVSPDNNSIPFSFSPLDPIPRIQSPLDRFRSISGIKSTPTPPGSGRKTPTVGVYSSTPSAMEVRLGNSQILYDGPWEPRPIEPQLTLEYIWTENLGVPLVTKGVEVEHASRVLISSDVLDQAYLCFLVKSRAKLMITKLNYTNEKNPETLIGCTTSIPAIDAATLPGLQMLAVLEANGGVTLYTGTTVVGKVHVAGIHTAQASSSYLTCATTGFLYQSPYLKRSSLLSSTQTGEALFDERVHLLSPVPSLAIPSSELTRLPPVIHDSHVYRLRDPVDKRLTLEFSNGSMFRIALPEICTSALVKSSLTALKCVLPKEVAVQLTTQWYTCRNAPGTQDISPQLEWQLFSRLLLRFLGYEVDKVIKNTISTESPDTPIQVKKKRSSDLGSQEDWIYLMGSEHHRAGGLQLCNLLGLQKAEIDNTVSQPQSGTMMIAALLFDYFHLVLFALHLLYEDLKLNLLMSESLPMLASFLQQLARDLRLQDYVMHYWKDFPLSCSISNTYTQLETCNVPQLPSSVSATPPCIFSQLYTLLMRWPIVKPYPYIAQINGKSGEMIQLVGMLCSGENNVEHLLRPVNITGSRTDIDKTPLGHQILKPSNVNITQHCISMLSSLGYTRRDLSVLPAGLSLILNDAIHRVREDPPPDWPESTYRLIGRQDLASTPPPPTVGERGTATPPPPAAARNTQDSDDGMDSMDREILKLRFNKDQRVSEARRLLQSSQPVTIAITQRPEVSDHEFIEEQEKHLYTICTRTMALPVGRGMLTLHTASPVSSEPLPTPRLCLSGRAPPRGTTVELTHIDVVPNMNLWPLFHNGVAAGLRIAPSATIIDTAWISYNKPKGGPEVLPEHAGFLMALGLNGHLRNLAQPNTCDYLTKCHEMTSIGVLLGISATKRGTMDLATTKMLSVHIECLLPPTSVELDIAQNVQVAALISIGLVYQGTAHRHMTEILLSEMGRPPGPEMENSVDRESYALAAGLGLGMVVLGRGSDISSLSDIGIADTLHYYMVGGHKRPLTGSQKEKYKSPSYQIREGECVNIAVTSPGATLALGMMYFNTGNKAVANWMNAPDTQYLLDFVCPDALLLRMVARGLILWEEIEPSVRWVESHVPDTIRPFCMVKPRPGTISDSVDLETMNQAYCNILAGACMAMGLRFAGSNNNEAFVTLLQYCKMITNLSNKSIAELAGKSTIEACLNVIVISLAMVMAGSGDLEVLRICRFLHSRVGQPTVTYGSHLATHMALGLLFLGGGRYSLSTSPSAVAALLCAFFPKFPTHSNDNRYHLQALRHLYVLAAESRLLLPRDIDTGSLCYAHITILYLDTEQYRNQKFTLKAPCILPELKYLKEVRVQDDRYWRVIFRRDKNWNQLKSLLTGCVGVKQRAGCLSYIEDPHGFRSLLAQTLTRDKAVAWAVPPDSIFSFSSDPSTVNFAHYFLEQPEGDCSNRFSSESQGELQVMHFLTKIVYECVTHDKLSIIPIWITIIKAMQNLNSSPCGHFIWQLKLMTAHGQSPCDEGSVPSVTPDMALSIKQQVSTILESWEKDLAGALWKYAHNQTLNDEPRILQQLAIYLTFHDFPPPDILAMAFSGKFTNPLMLQLQLGQYVPVSTVWKLTNLKQSSPP